jgi:hypothetical protein
MAMLEGGFAQTACTREATMVHDLTENRFRRARGRILRDQIASLSRYFGRDIVILDVGGRSDYWNNVGLDNIAMIRLLNNDVKEFDRIEPEGIFSREIGDARNLANHADKSIDLVHANSVIEHVGQWPEMCAMAQEVLRVGISGWIQTPAWEFPIEPHFQLPFLHWFGQPVRRIMLAGSRHYRSLDTRGRRHHVDRINLLSHAEVEALFPACEIFVERFFFLAKSYTARWAPAGMT